MTTDSPAEAPPPPLLTPDVAVIVHPVDRTQHPTYPPGYRWAVMVGGRPPADLDYCANAGHAPTETLAMTVGESHAAAVVKALRMQGFPAVLRRCVLTWDPIPAEADDRPLGIFKDDPGRDAA